MIESSARKNYDIELTLGTDLNEIEKVRTFLHLKLTTFT